MDQLLRDYVLGRQMPEGQKRKAAPIAHAAGLGGQRQKSKLQACQRDADALAAAVRDMTGLDITMRSRKAPVVMIRQAVIWLLTEHGHSLSHIAASGLGFADHTTAVHAHKKVRADPRLKVFAADVEACRGEAVRAALVRRDGGQRKADTAVEIQRARASRRAQIIAAAQRGDVTYVDATLPKLSDEE